MKALLVWGGRKLQQRVGARGRCTPVTMLPLQAQDVCWHRDAGKAPHQEGSTLRCHPKISAWVSALGACRSSSFSVAPPPRATSLRGDPMDRPTPRRASRVTSATPSLRARPPPRRPSWA